MAKQPEIGNKPRWTPEELGITKATFAEQEGLMILIRKFLLQGEMTKDEMNYLKSVTDQPAVIAILEKSVNPRIDKQAPAFQGVDLFSHLDMNSTPKEHVVEVMKARHLAVDYLDQQFEALRAKKAKTPKIIFDDMIAPTNDPEKAYIGIVARNFLLSHIDSQLFGSLLLLAGVKEETPEEQKERITRDSSK